MSLIERFKNSRLATALYGIMEYMHLTNNIDPRAIDRRRERLPLSLQPNQPEAERAEHIDDTVGWMSRTFNEAQKKAMEDRQKGAVPTMTYIPEEADFGWYNEAFSPENVADNDTPSTELGVAVKKTEDITVLWHPENQDK